MRPGLLVSASLAGLALAACMTKQERDGGPAPCETTCAGCCDSGGACVVGTAQFACGSAGAACQDCSSRHATCFEQRCLPAPDGGGAGGGGGATGGDGGSTGGGGGGSATDAGPSTYGDGGTRYRFWDGGSCTVETDCPCFSSDDCGPGFYCHSRDSTGTNVFCVPGARGVGLAGDSCAGEADCLSALCTDSASTGMRCSALCDVPAECPATLPRCTYIGFGVDRSICAP